MAIVFVLFFLFGPCLVAVGLAGGLGIRVIHIPAPVGVVGGKKVLAKIFAFSSLSLTSVRVPSATLTLIVGILGVPPSPTGLLRYLFAVHMSSVVISSRYSAQCERLNEIMALPYILLFCLSSL